MAADLGIECFAVSGRLINLWGWFDSHTTDGKVSSRLRNAIDAHCAQEGFVTALESVGWIQEKDGMLCIKKFKERHGKSGKRRALAARRASRFRNAHAVTKSAPEKRREEKNKDTAKAVSKTPLPPLPESLNTVGFIAAWEAWQRHRRQKKKPLTDEQAAQQLENLAPLGAERSIAAIKHSIASGYQGIFEPKEHTHGNRSTRDGIGHTHDPQRRIGTLEP